MGPVLVAAARESSTDSFHLAMALSAGLLLAGALVNAAGIRDPQRGDGPTVPGEAPGA